MSADVVIVGASLAGVRTAQALRLADYPGRVVMIGDEPEQPYDRPPLSKDFLAGSRDRNSLLLARPAVPVDELLLGVPAVSVDPLAHEVRLSSGRSVVYGKLVVATGARPRRLPWNDRPDVHVLRSMGDAEGLRDALTSGGTLVVLGAGFVGAEVAATARQSGIPVSMVDAQTLPGTRILGRTMAQRVVELHHRNGVRTHFGVSVADISGPHGAPVVELADGERIAAAAVLVGIGAVPSDEWLAGSGLEVKDGLVCDPYCRAQGVDDVYAAGDIARWTHPVSRASIRSEHWTNAVEQAELVAHNLMHPDEPRPYSPIDYVWSDQYDWKIQIVGGLLDSATETTISHPTASGRDRFATLYADEAGLLVGAACVNWVSATNAVRRALADHAPAEAIAWQLEPAP